MTKQHAMEIIQKEELHNRVNWFRDTPLKENEVVIEKVGAEWSIFITNERASMIDGTRFGYRNEEEAYDALIRKARYLKKLYK